MNIGKSVATYCCCLILTFLTANLLAGFIVFSLRVHHASPAICQDGRLADAATNANASVAIDVPPGGVIEIGCLVPVAVYDARRLHEPRDNLRQVGLQGPIQIPLERASSGVTCLHHNASVFDHFNNIAGLQFYKNCKSDKWDCNQGACTAYEKALRTCLSNLAPKAYKCSYVPGKPMWGATSTAKQIQQGLYIFFALAFMMVLSVFFLVWDKDSVYTLSFKFDGYMALAMLVFGGIFTYTYAHSMTGQPPFWNQVADLNSCTTGDLHMCGPPLLEEAPWNRTIGPKVYFVVHTVPLILLVLFCACPRLLIMALVLARGGSRPADDERTPLV